MPTAADSGQIDMAGAPDGRRRLGQPAVTSSTKIINCPLEFEGLAEYVLQEVRHGLGSPQKNRFRKPLSWLPFLAHPASLSSFLLQQRRVQAILPVPSPLYS